MEQALIEIVTNEVRVALSKNTAGLSQNKIYAETSADNMVDLVKVLSRMIKSGEVVNLSGTVLGPYVLKEYAPEDHQPQPQTEEEVVDQLDDLVEEVDAKFMSILHSEPEAPVQLKSLPAQPIMGSLTPKSAAGIVAYAAYTLHVENPGMFLHHNYLYKKLDFFGFTGKHRSVVISQLVAKEYLERSPGGETRINPFTRWNAKKFRYPFPSLDVIPALPSIQQAKEPADSGDCYVDMVIHTAKPAAPAVEEKAEVQDGNARVILTRLLSIRSHMIETRDELNQAIAELDSSIKLIQS